MSTPTALTSPAPVAVPEPARGAFRSLLADSALVFRRELRPMRRDPFSVIFTMVQPLVFLAFFGPLLDQVPGTTDGSTLQWFVPGIIVMSALFGASTTGANLQDEIMSGSYERMLVTPLRRPALLLGRAAKEIAPVVVQVVVIVAVTIPFGFELSLPGAIVGVGVVAAFAIGLGSMSHALALAAKDNQWMFWAVQQTVLFPLLLLSGMLLPIDDGPGWIEVLSALDPLTYIVDAERALFAGELATTTVFAGIAVAAAVLATGLAIGIRAVRNDVK